MYLRHALHDESHEANLRELLSAITPITICITTHRHGLGEYDFCDTDHTCDAGAWYDANNLRPPRIVNTRF